MSGVTFLSSCGTDTTPPTIMLNAAPGFTSADVSVPAGTILQVGIIAKSTSSKLTNFKIIQTVSGTPTTIEDTTISADAYNVVYTIPTLNVASVAEYTFKITASDGETAEASFNVTTTAAAINSYTAVLLGGQLNANLGSFYSTADNSVMNLATARTNSQKADMVYYFGTTNEASIVAISDAQLADVPTFVECATWTTKNSTKFKLTTGVDWATIVDESGITANTTGLVDTHVNKLKVGDIVAFQTATTSNNASKKGLYKVIEINGTSGADLSIKIEVKIQK